MVSNGKTPFRLSQLDSQEVVDPKLGKDLRLLGLFIEMYCGVHHQNRESEKQNVQIPGQSRVIKRPLRLCPECSKLLAHAWVKRASCPLDPKPACKHCPSHCYHPTYRKQIREVMRESGKRLVLRGRLDYLFKLLF